MHHLAVAPWVLSGDDDLGRVEFVRPRTRRKHEPERGAQMKQAEKVRVDPTRT